MAGSLNKVILVGNLGNDPDIRQTQSGDKVANISIATSESYKDKSGQRQTKTEWHRVVMFGRIAEVAEQYLRKGSKVLIEGKLQTRSYDKNGQTVYTTEIVLPPYTGVMTMLDSAGGQQGGGQNQSMGQNQGGGQQGGGYGNSMQSSQQNSDNGFNSGYDSNAGGFNAADLDDDIPF